MKDIDFLLKLKTAKENLFHTNFLLSLSSRSLENGCHMHLILLLGRFKYTKMGPSYHNCHIIYWYKFNNNCELSYRYLEYLVHILGYLSVSDKTEEVRVPVPTF